MLPAYMAQAEAGLKGYACLRWAYYSNADLKRNSDARSTGRYDVPYQCKLKSI